MKNYLKLIAVISICAITACNKENAGNPHLENYSSLSQFYAMNGVAMQTYTINAVSGGSFTTPQGTVVTIPPNAFVTQSSQPVTGSVTVEFKDIYKKSDMLLSNMPPMFNWGGAMKSGGEAFIRVFSGTSVVDLAPGKKIDISQPIINSGDARDTMMLPLAVLPDTSFIPGGGWTISPADSLYISTTNYVFSLYTFTAPLDSGNWVNSDNPSAFNGYPQTTFTLHPSDSITVYNPDVFLLFQNVNSMVHVYSNGTEFPYFYAPSGLQCTVVAIGMKNGVLYSSFTPVTIGTNQTVNFTLSATNAAAFKTQLETYN